MVGRGHMMQIFVHKDWADDLSYPCRVPTRRNPRWYALDHSVHRKGPVGCRPGPCLLPPGSPSGQHSLAGK
jgi:hypothetical protein